jgi:predicted Zn-dependent peptidase
VTRLPAILALPLLVAPTFGDALFPLASVGTRTDAGAVRASFDNGLRVLCVQNQGTGTVAVSAFVNTSARAEAATQTGLRYFLARALVESSAAEQPDLAHRLRELGADAFAGATLDLSQITVTAAAEDVGPAAGLLRDILFRPRFSEASLGRLRRQVVANLAAAGQSPEVAAEHAAADRLYPSHPFGRPVEGLAATVSTFDLPRIEAVYRQSYVPNNLRIVVAGGVPPEVSLEALRKAFGDVLPGTRLEESTEPPRPPREGAEELRRPSGTALIHLGARAPGLADDVYPAAAVALAILGSGMGSRLYLALRQSDGVAYSFSAEARASREGARAGVLAACPPERVDETEGRMVLALRQMTTELATAEEILRAKEYIATGYAITHQRSADLVHQLGALEIASDQGLELDRDLPRRIGEVTAEQVRDAARAMFATRVRVRVLPS